jgi:hypothetical protein
MLVNGLGRLHSLEKMESIIGFFFIAIQETLLKMDYLVVTAVPSNPKKMIFRLPIRLAIYTPKLNSFRALSIFYN